MLLSALLSDPRAAVAAGCYVDPEGADDGYADAASCFTHRFSMRPGGLLSMVHVTPEAASCIPVGVAQNFLLARTDVLRVYGWDPRMKVGEHEAFFYALHVNGQQALSCPSVTAMHDSPRTGHRPAEYTRDSLR